jgi:hypothetical protein
VRDAAYVLTLNEPNLAACLPVLAAMAARGEPVAGLPRPDERLSQALVGVHRRGMEELRGAGSPPAGYSLVGQEWIAEEGADEMMAAHRASMEDQFLAAAEGDDFVGMQIYSCARIGPDGPVAPPVELTTQAHVEYRPQALGAAVRRVSSVLPERCAACTRPSGMAPTSAATSTGACWTTSSGSVGTDSTVGKSVSHVGRDPPVAPPRTVHVRFAGVLTIVLHRQRSSHGERNPNHQSLGGSRPNAPRRALSTPETRQRATASHPSCRRICCRGRLHPVPVAHQRDLRTVVHLLVHQNQEHLTGRTRLAVVTRP